MGLLVLVVLRKLLLPPLIKGQEKYFAIIFAFLQLCVFVFNLTALANDSWSETAGAAGSSGSYGVTRFHEKGNQSNYASYGDCQGDTDQKNMCGTYKAAGAFTLIFGLVGVISSLLLLISVGASLLGKATPLDAWVAVLANIDWVCALAQVMIWVSLALTASH